MKTAMAQLVLGVLVLFCSHMALAQGHVDKGCVGYGPNLNPYHWTNYGETYLLKITENRSFKEINFNAFTRNNDGYGQIVDVNGADDGGYKALSQTITGLSGGGGEAWISVCFDWALEGKTWEEVKDIPVTLKATFSYMLRTTYAAGTVGSGAAVQVFLGDTEAFSIGLFNRNNTISSTETTKLVTTVGNLRNVQFKQVKDISFNAYSWAAGGCVDADVQKECGINEAHAEIEMISASVLFGPVAKFKIDKENPGYTQLITFDAGDSTPSPNGKIDEYTWDFGKNLSTGERDIETTDSPIIQRAFTKPDKYTVKLTVKDNEGKTDDEEHEIEVSDQCQGDKYLRAGVIIVGPEKQRNCPPVGNKLVSWDIYTNDKHPPKPVLEFNSLETLHIACSAGDNHHYEMSYYHPWLKEAHRVGLCPFYGGSNSRSFYDTGDQIDLDGKPKPDGKPDCLVQTSWISRDYWCNDDRYSSYDPITKKFISCDGPWIGYNSWTGYQENRVWFGEVYEQEEEERLDWAQTDFFANERNVIKWDLKYVYRSGPGANSVEGYGPAEGYPIVTKTDPPLGPETEAFFDRITANLKALIPNDALPSDATVMTSDWYALCDITMDGLCDQEDMQTFQSILGLCHQDPGYHPLADIDRDGCITLEDEIYLFQQDSDEDSVPNAGDKCPARDEQPTVVVGDCDSFVDNKVNAVGCSISRQIGECAESATNHGSFVSCVAHLTNDLKKARIITGAEKGAIQSCAAQASIP